MTITPIRLNLRARLNNRRFRRRFLATLASDEIASQIRSLREQRGFTTQVAFAKAANMHQSAVSRIEQAGYSGWTFKTLLHVAETLDARLRVTFEPLEDVLNKSETSEMEAAIAAVQSDRRPAFCSGGRSPCPGSVLAARGPRSDGCVSLKPDEAPVMPKIFGNLWRQLRRKVFRERFVESELKRGIAFQIQAMMKHMEMTQATLAERSGLTQGVISSAANPAYGNLTINTIVRIAAGFDVAFVGEFVPFSRLANRMGGLSEKKLGSIRRFDEEDASAHEPIMIESAASSDACVLREIRPKPMGRR